MEDQIPQSFKVQWINTTLKYLKNDNQLIMEYPEMPVHHMEYLHTLIWQRKNDVGLGFKSMYAPVWEAMRIFSLKYQFKVCVNKSVDGQKGHLVIEKIPKNEQFNKGQVKQDNQEPAKVDDSELAKQGEDSQSTDSEDSSQSQPESPMKNPMTGLKKPTKTKPKKKKKKSQKFVIDKQKIIESISPVLLRKALQKILDFLLKQEEASIIFSDLAPVEARFLENFLGIYNKRQSFQGILSPACNELLDKMCEFFKEFDKQCKLEVYAAKYNVNTKKREVTFMKVPRYTRTNATLSQSNFIAPQVKAENIPTVSPFRNSKEKCAKPIISQTMNSNLKITLSNENTTKNDVIEKRDVKFSMNSENREDKLSINAENRDNKSSVHNSIVNTTNTNYSNHRKNEEVKSFDITKYDTTDKIYNKNVKLFMNAGTKDNKITEKVENKDTREEQKRSENKEYLKQEIEVIDFAIDTPKRILPETKIETPTISKTKLRDGYLGPRKEKLLTAMMTPLESDKAMRMMRLMGWQGGALGLHGHGIVEPLIPALDIVPGKGLGHVAEKQKPTKSVKEVSKPNKAVKISKTTRVENRTKFLKTILDLICKDISESTVTYPTQLVRREIICYEVIIQSLNDRLYLTLTESEGPILMNMLKIMKEKPELSLKMIFAADFRELTITKLNKKQTPLTIMADPRKKCKEDVLKIDTQMSKKDFRLQICSTILEFLKSDDTEKLVDLDAVLTVNYFKIVETICSHINKRTKVPHSYMTELFAKILDNTKECYLEVKMKDESPTRSFLLRKLYYRKPYVNNEVLKNIINKYTDTTIPVTDIKKDDVNGHKDDKTRKSNNNYSKEINKDNTDLVNNSVVDNEIKENVQKTSEHDDLDYNIKLNDHINEMRGKNLKENLVRYPLYFKNMNTVDGNDFRRIDMDLLQATIKSLTLHDKKSEENHVKLHNSEMNTYNHENNNFDIKDNSKYTESSKQSDKTNLPCQITKNIRKWYAHSEKFLICDDLVKNTSMEDVDSNNNGNQVTFVSKLSEDTKSDKPNQNFETHSKLEHNDHDLKLLSEYEGCDGFKDSMDGVKSNESHRSVEKHLESNIIQIKGNSRNDLKSISEADVCSDNQNSLDVTETEKSCHEDKKHAIYISHNVTKQGSEFCNAIKELIDLGILNQTEKYSESDIVGISVEDKSENLNPVSINGVITNSIEESDMIELKETHQVNEKHSELDLSLIETHNEEVLNDYAKDESQWVNCDVIRGKQHYEENSEDYGREYSYKCTKTDETNSKLDVITVELDYKEELTLEPQKSHQTDTNFKLNTKQNEAHNMKELILTNDFEIDESNISPKEGVIHSELVITKIKTDCNENVSLKRKYDTGELEQSYESFKAKHNRMFDIDQFINDNIEDLKQRSNNEKEDLDKTDKINSKLDTFQEETEEKSTASEPESEKPEESHRKEVNSELDIIQVGTGHKGNLSLINEPEAENLQEYHRREGDFELDIIQVGTDHKENLTLINEPQAENLEECYRNEDDFELNVIKGGTDFEEKSMRVTENPENSHKSEEIYSKLDMSQLGTNYKEMLTLKSELDGEASDKIDPNMDEFQVNVNHINADYMNDSRHVNGNRTKELNNARKIDKNCHDIVLIESNILEIEAIQKKIKNIIENMGSENVQVFRPLLKYHGVLENGIVYSCHNKDTCLWLKNVLADHNVIDYRTAVDNHKLKIKVTSSKKDAKKLLELLEVFNYGLKCNNWKILYENHYCSSLIIGVEIDSSSFEYICDNNFSLSVGYDFAQFSIAH